MALLLSLVVDLNMESLLQPLKFSSILLDVFECPDGRDCLGVSGFGHLLLQLFTIDIKFFKLFVHVDIVYFSETCPIFMVQTGVLIVIERLLH